MNMKQYTVYFYQSSTARVTVNADSEEQAEEQAWSIVSDRHFETDTCDIDYVEETGNENK